MTNVNIEEVNGMWRITVNGRCFRMYESEKKAKKAEKRISETCDLLELLAAGFRGEKP